MSHWVLTTESTHTFRDKPGQRLGSWRATCIAHKIHFHRALVAKIGECMPRSFFFPIKLYVFLGNWRSISSPNHTLWAVFPPLSTATQIAIDWPNRTQLAVGLPLFSEKARRASLCFLRKYEVFPLRLFSFFFFSRTLLALGGPVEGVGGARRRRWR